MSKLRTTAYITVTIEVPLSSYGEEWQLKDIYEQAEREGTELVSQMVRTKLHGRVVGDVKIKTVTVAQE